MDDTIAIIPARAGSKSVVQKNIRPLGGYPLMAYSIAAAKMARRVTRVIVSTDSSRYADLARRFGAEAPFLRPEHLSGDDSPDTGFILHALNWLKTHQGACPKFLVHLRPTTPFRDPALIDEAIARMQTHPEATALRSVQPMTKTVPKCFDIQKGLLKQWGSDNFDLEKTNDPRQNYPASYEGNGYVDILRSHYILSHGKIHGDCVLAFVTPSVGEVDTDEDFQFLQYQARQNSAIVAALRQKIETLQTNQSGPRRD